MQVPSLHCSSSTTAVVAVLSDKEPHKYAAKNRLRQIQVDQAAQIKALQFLDYESPTPDDEKDPSGLLKLGIDLIKLELIKRRAEIQILQELSALTDDEKLEILFEVVDVNDSGDIDVSELVHLIQKFVSYNNVSFDLGESLRVATRRVKSFDQDNNERLDMDEFKMMLRTLAETRGYTVPEMCELFLDCLFLHENDQDSPELDEEGLQDFSRVWETKLQQLFNLFGPDKDGFVPSSHVELLAFMINAKVNGEPFSLTIDDFDDGTMDFARFTETMYKTSSGSPSRGHFLMMMETVLSQIMADGSFSEWGHSPTDIDVSAIHLFSVASHYLRIKEKQETSTRSSSLPVDRKPNEKTLSQRTSSIRRKATVLRAASLATISKDEEVSNVSELVRSNKTRLQTEIIRLTHLLGLMEEYMETEQEERVQAIFQALDRDGDGKVNGLELARGLMMIQDKDLASCINKAVTDIATFDMDGDSMLDPSEFEKYVDALAEKADMPRYGICDLFIMQLIPLQKSLDDVMKVISLERVNEHIQVQEFMLNGFRGARLRSLFALLDTEVSNSVSQDQIFLASKHIGKENMTVLTKKLESLRQSQRRIDMEEFTHLLFEIACESSPTNPLTIFDTLVGKMTDCILTELIPTDYTNAGAA